LEKKKVDSFRQFESEKSGTPLPEKKAPTSQQQNQKPAPKNNAKLEQRIEKLEKEIKAYEEKMYEPDFIEKAEKDPLLYKKYEQLKNDLEVLYNELLESEG
jgi:valyl-tRNA synthetase